MRDLILLGFIAGGLGMTLRYPFVGVLLWAWFTLATPQQSAYAAASLPLNMIIAGVTFLSCFFHSEFRRIRLDIISVLLILFAGWLGISQIMSLDPDNSAQYFDRFLKILIFVFLCMMTVTTRLRFHALLWVFAIIMGFHGAKGGAYTLATLGQNLYFGIPNSILYDNNHMGIALAASLPIFLYLQGQVAHPLVKRAIQIVFGLSIIAILGTHSRGALVSLLAFGGFMWLRSSNKVVVLILVVFASVPALVFMPESWKTRMQTIENATEDASFRGRLDAWEINLKIANAHPLTGAGLRNPYEEKIARQVDQYLTPRAAHSIYFEILGGAGYIGFLLYMALLGTAFLKAAYSHSKYRFSDEGRWRSSFGYYAQVSLVVFGVGGASVSMEMWEGYLLIIALISSLRRIGPEETERPVVSPVSRVRQRVEASTGTAASAS